VKLFLRKPLAQRDGVETIKHAKEGWLLTGGLKYGTGVGFIPTSLFRY
jgi:hypothetical protein